VETVNFVDTTEIDALADDIAVTAAHIDAATHRLLTLIRELDLGRAPSIACPQRRGNRRATEVP
jgi:hypothetical protein